MYLKKKYCFNKVTVNRYQPKVMIIISDYVEEYVRESYTSNNYYET